MRWNKGLDRDKDGIAARRQKALMDLPESGSSAAA